MPYQLLAFDLGAESGRGVLGRFDGEKVDLQVVHRFPNGPVRTMDAWHWDVLRLYSEMLTALRRCAAEHGTVDSMGVDTWGVDFALLGRGDTLLGNPRHYRDPHTEGMLELAFERVPRQRIFELTGLQFLRFNTLFQLLALRQARSPLLDVAESMLLMPDLFHFFLTGVKANEFTDATTSQLYDPSRRCWARELTKAFEVPDRILGTIVPAGTVLGRLRPPVSADTGAGTVQVVVPATHDTGSAVAAVPAKGNSWAYISSGTWSLMGVEIPAPVINEKALAYNFTNEGGVGGSIRFLKNIMGLWLVQECRRSWEKSGTTYDYEELAAMAHASSPFVSMIDPDDASFLLPEDMPSAIADYCRRTGQPVPSSTGALVRCALESLALRYRWVLERLEELLSRRLDVIHVVGGGSQNKFLCQLTADACNRRVLAGPAEATALGNVLVQAIGLGLLKDLGDAREVARRSFAPQSYEPKASEQWHEPYQRFLRMVQ
jgi:rhamnulokinase